MKVKLLSRVQLFETPWTAAHQASLSITNSRSLLKLMSIESVMPSSHFILCRPLLLLPPIPPSIRVFSNESTLRMRWPKYWSFSSNISPSNEHPEWCWSWNSNTLATWWEELTHWKRPWCWEGLGAGEEGDDRGWNGWMASPIRWTWVWVNSGSWWWTGRPGVLRLMGSQRVGHNWATELNKC